MTLCLFSTKVYTFRHKQKRKCYFCVLLDTLITADVKCFHYYLKLRNCNSDIIPKVVVKLFWDYYAYFLPQCYSQIFLILWKMHWYIKGYILNKIKYIYTFLETYCSSTRYFYAGRRKWCKSYRDWIYLQALILHNLSQYGLYGKNSNINL